MSALREAMSHAVLGWVKPELDETLRLARGEIEAFVETPADTSRMRFCAGYLHQVQGTLRMVELYAPAMVAEELELLATALQEGAVTDRDEACSTLMRGAVLLPDYLERLQDGHRDIPIVLLPLLNDIRSARGATVLNESMLFPPGTQPDAGSEPSAEEIAHARSSISGRNRELLGTVGNAVKEELLRVKDALDLHLRTRENPEALGQQVGELGNVADTLGMMGLGVARDVVLQQRDALRDVAEGRREADEGTLLDIAGALLYVDASLDDQVARLGGPGNEAGADASVVESQRTVEVLAQEAIINFAAAREKFVAFIETNWNHDELADVPRLLDEVTGAMRMLELDHAGDYVTGVRRYVGNELIGKRRIPGGQQLDTLADALASLEYYLEALRERRPNREDILEITRSSLENLRYWPLPELVTEVAATPAAATPAVAAPIAQTVEEAAPDIGGAIEPVFAPSAPVNRDDATANPFDPVGFEYDESAQASPPPSTVPVDWNAVELAPESEARDEPAQVHEVDHDTAAVFADIEAAAAALRTEQPEAISPAAPNEEPAARIEPAFEPAVEAEPAAPVASPSAIPASAGGFDSDAGDIDDEIREVFLEEFDEEIVNLRQLLPVWRNQPEDLERLRPIRRVFHTLKGSGRLVGARTLGEFSWKIENMLNRVLDRTRAPSTAVIVLLEQVFEVLPQLNAALRGEAPVTADLDGLKQVADRIAGGEEAFYGDNAAASEAPQAVTFEPGATPVIADAAHEAPAPRFDHVPQAGGTPASVDAVLREILEAEVATHLDTMHAWLAASRETPQPASEMLLRAMHTMNGAFAMADVPEIIEVTAPAEQYIKRLLAVAGTPTAAGVNALSETAEAIARSVDALSSPSPRIPVFAELSARLSALRDSLPDVRAAAQTVNDHAQKTYAGALGQLAPVNDMELSAHDLSAYIDPVHVDTPLPETSDAAAAPDAPMESVESIESVVHVEAGLLAEPVVPEVHFDAPAEPAHLDYAVEAPPSPLVSGGVTYFDVAYSYKVRGREETEQAGTTASEAAAQGDAAPAIAPATDTVPGSSGLTLSLEPMERTPEEAPLAVDAAPGASDDVLVIEEIVLDDTLSPADADDAAPPAATSDAADAFVFDTADAGTDATALEFESPVEADAVESAPTADVDAGVSVEARDGFVAIETIALQITDPATLQDATPTPPDPATPVFWTEAEAEPESRNVADAPSGQPIPEWDPVAAETADADEAAVQADAAQDSAPEAAPGFEAELEPQADGIETPVAESDIASTAWDIEPEVASDDTAPVEAADEVEASADGTEIIEVADAGQAPALDTESDVSVPAEPADSSEDVEAIEAIAPIAEAPEAPTAEATEATEVEIAGPAIAADAIASIDGHETGDADHPVDVATLEEQPEDALDLAGLDLDLVEIFIEEGNDLLDHSDDLLAKLRETPEDRALVTSLQRDLHTLKGGARMAGIHPVGDLGHAIESMLESIVAQRTELDLRGIKLLERGFDALHQQLERVSARQAVRVPDGMIAEFNAHARGVEMPEPVARQPDAPKAPVALAPLSAPVETEFTQDDEFFPHTQQEQVRVRADLLDRLVNHAGEVAIYRARLEQQLGAFRGAMAELERTNTRLHDQLRRLDLETEAQIVARYQREQDQQDATFDPLELDRFSTLQQLSRALAESAADISGLQGVLDDLARNYDSLLHQQSRVSSELQDGLMRARMVPFEGIVPRLRRVLRQAATETGKQARLLLEGTHGEMDRNVLERMTAPLEHLLRNSVAHGLESPEQRTKGGKVEEGTVRVALRREGSEMVIEVSDDGAGLNRDAIRARAEKRGLLQPGAVIDDIDLDRLILESGFSTYDSVSQLAGRGVGMDVVYNEVRQLGGALDIHSRPGEGAQFTLRLPQTLAVTQAAFVQIGETQFAVPVASVSGIGRISRERFEAGTGSYHYGGEEYALYNLGHLLGHAPARAEGQSQVPLLLIRAGDMRAAVAVDQVLGNREIVVKPVGPQIASIPGIYGATITGDGSVVVILDIAPLVRRHLAQPAYQEAAAATAEQRHVPLVMVVDDSLTMRKVTSRVLERHNFEVTVARDGVEALERLEERVPDLMLLDIEMPRMDGYELATAMKGDERFRDVPIVMITSRTGDKHRQRAFDIGVQRYMGKPYQELDLMRNVYDLLGIARVRE